MCTIDTIRLSMLAILTIKVIFALFIVITGLMFSTTDVIIKSYGEFFIEAGVGIVMIGLSSLAIVYPMHFAIKRHNRFVLLALFIIEGILMSQVITVGLTCYAPTASIFPTALMTDCSQHKPAIYTQEECDLYLHSDRTMGFRLVWATWFTQVNNQDFYQLMTQLEDANICCGFGPPLRCFNDTDSFPSDRPTTNIRSDLSSQRWKCGLIEYYYPKQSNCMDYSEPNTLPRILGGCEVDMGAGNCVELTTGDTSKGCSLAVETYVATLVAPQSVILVGSSFMNVLCMLICCCMFWKRKEFDVFPDYINNQQDVNPRFANYLKIKDNVVVVPVKDYLLDKGFLPPPNVKEKKNDDLQNEGGDVEDGGVELSRIDNDNISALTNNAKPETD